MIKKFFISALLLLNLSAGAVYAQFADNLKFDGYISDNANILREEAKENINLTLDDLNKKTSAAIAIATFPSIEGNNIEQVSEYILNTYKIGDDEKKNGIVISIAMEERNINVFLGDAYQDKTDTEIIRNLINDNIIPYFAKEDYEGGVIRGTYTLADEVAKMNKKRIKHFGKLPKKLNQQGKQDFNKNWFWLLLLPAGAVLGWLIAMLVKSEKSEN